MENVRLSNRIEKKYKKLLDFDNYNLINIECYNKENSSVSELESLNIITNINIKIDKLINAIKLLDFRTIIKDEKFNFLNFHINTKDNSFIVTDGKILLKSELKTCNDFNTFNSFNIPFYIIEFLKKQNDDVIKYLKYNENNRILNIITASNYYKFHFRHEFIKFPNYNNIIPEVSNYDLFSTIYNYKTELETEFKNIKKFFSVENTIIELNKDNEVLLKSLSKNNKYYKNLNYKIIKNRNEYIQKKHKKCFSTEYIIDTFNYFANGCNEYCIEWYSEPNRLKMDIFKTETDFIYLMPIRMTETEE